MSDQQKTKTKPDGRTLREIAGVFLKLGTFAYGGPAAHTAMMHQELVERRKWLSEARFLDLMSASNLIPGPNSTELAIQLGYERGGWRGLLLAGICFIFPALLIVLVLSHLYLRFGFLPAVQSILRGVVPVVLAIILQALIKLARASIKKAWYVIVLLSVMLLAWFGVEEVALIAFGGLLMVLLHRVVKQFRQRTTRLNLLLPVGLSALGIGFAEVFLRFLKIGAILYGSGYVLIAYLESEFVRPGFLSQQQLLDAVTIGQVTPGPVFTTATFVGYVLRGLSGALLATAGIFLPSFLLVALLVKLTQKMRQISWLGKALDGINLASLGLMAMTAVRLGQSHLTHPLPWVVLVLSYLALDRLKINATYLIVGGAAIGFFFPIF